MYSSILKGYGILALIIIMLNMTPIETLAEEMSSLEPNIVVPTQLVEDEYINILQTRSNESIYTFSFKVKTTSSSEKFRIASSSVIVTSNAHIRNANNVKLPGDEGHRYKIIIEGGSIRKTLNFKVGETASQTVTGLKANQEYKITVTNVDSIPSGYYLIGTCEVK